MKLGNAWFLLALVLCAMVWCTSPAHAGIGVSVGGPNGVRVGIGAGYGAGAFRAPFRAPFRFRSPFRFGYGLGFRAPFVSRYVSPIRVAPIVVPPAYIADEGAVGYLEQAVVDHCDDGIRYVSPLRSRLRLNIRGY